MLSYSPRTWKFNSYVCVCLRARVAHAVDEHRRARVCVHECVQYFDTKRNRFERVPHHYTRRAILRSREYMKAKQNVYARGSATMHARTHAHTHLREQLQEDRHRNTQHKQKQSNPQTCADSFTLVSLDPVPSGSFLHIAELLQWCVRARTPPISTSCETCLICDNRCHPSA